MYMIDKNRNLSRLTTFSVVPHFTEISSLFSELNQADGQYYPYTFISYTSCKESTLNIKLSKNVKSLLTIPPTAV